MPPKGLDPKVKDKTTSQKSSRQKENIFTGIEKGKFNSLSFYRHVISTPIGLFAIVTDHLGLVHECYWPEAKTGAQELIDVNKSFIGTHHYSLCDTVNVDLPGADAARRFHDYFNYDLKTARESSQSNSNLNKIYPHSEVQQPNKAAIEKRQKDLQEILDGIALPDRLLNQTHFSQMVWRCLRDSVPAGSVATYKGLGELCSGGNSRLARAVGCVMRRNPLPVVVPCHRIIDGKGALHGFSCGLKYKVWLLRHERAPLPAKAFQGLESECGVTASF